MHDGGWPPEAQKPINWSEKVRVVGKEFIRVGGPNCDHFKLNPEELCIFDKGERLPGG
jgi:hypothetical protein